MTRKKYFAAVCGIKNSGKTTLIEGIIRTLTGRGLKVAVIKHDGHDFECDIPGTDSWRFAKAGACGVSVYSGSQFFIRKMRENRGPEDVFLRSLTKAFPEADVLLIEGCKDYPFRKIEVVRSPVSDKPVSNPAGLFLVVSNLPEEETGVRTLPFEELDRIADAILETEAGDGFSEKMFFEKMISENVNPEKAVCEDAVPGGEARIINKMPAQKALDRSADCCAVLLRGGRSRRMGMDKALLSWEGKTFLQTIADQMDIFEEKYLSVAAEPDKAAGPEVTHLDGLLQGWKVLPDRIPDCGPMGGIWTALSACRAEWALTASCDIPAVRQSFFLKLLDSRSEDVDIVCPVTSDGRMHMTCALYRRSAAPLLEARLREGNYRMRSLFSCCRVKTVPVTDPEEERMLSNINTPEELDRVRGRHD